MERLLCQAGTYFLGNNTSECSKLPIGIYNLCQNPATGVFFLTVAEQSMELPGKVYGDHSSVKRWLKYWNTSTGNLGIILTGLKGTGKTVTAKMVCLQSNAPVIIIDQPYAGPQFMQFLSHEALQGSVLFIDEFEKIYKTTTSFNTDDDDEAPVVNTGTPTSLLTLMSGAFTTKLLFLMTMNNKDVSDLMVNRLERVRYCQHYGSLDRSVIDEVAKDMLKNKKHTESLHQFFSTIGICTYDLLVNIIKEMNLFGEDAITCGKYLNLKAERRYYNITEIIKGKEVECYGTYLDKTNKEFTISRRTEESAYSSLRKAGKLSHYESIKIGKTHNIEIGESHKEFFIVNEKGEKLFRCLEENRDVSYVF